MMLATLLDGTYPGLAPAPSSGRGRLDAPMPEEGPMTMARRRQQTPHTPVSGRHRTAPDPNARPLGGRNTAFFCLEICTSRRQSDLVANLNVLMQTNRRTADKCRRRRLHLSAFGGHSSAARPARKKSCLNLDRAILCCRRAECPRRINRWHIGALTAARRQCRSAKRLRRRQRCGQTACDMCCEVGMSAEHKRTIQDSLEDDLRAAMEEARTVSTRRSPARLCSKRRRQGSARVP